MGGTYGVELVVTDDDGSESRESKTITVGNTPPELIFVYDPDEPSPDKTVQFDAPAATACVRGASSAILTEVRQEAVDRFVVTTCRRRPRCL
jgi:hypothetical protein